MFYTPLEGLAARLAPIQGGLQTEVRPPAIIPFGDWRPDGATLGNPGDEALNVIPAPDGYRPVKDLSPQSDALDARCQGAGAATDTSGDVSFYAGDASKLYLLSGSVFNDAATGLTTAAADQWEFTQFGGKMIACNGHTDNVQADTVGVGTFTDLMSSTLKPKAKHLAVVRDFLVLGNTSDAVDGVKPSRVWWSGINDSTDFDPAASTQSDFQDIPGDAGFVQKVVGGVEYGLVFLERSIQRMTYVGSPRVFRFDPVDLDRGTPIPGSVVSLGRQVFYISAEGFFYTDGNQSFPIGDEKVDRTFWNQFDTSNAARVTSAVDPLRKLILWSFPGANNLAGAPNLIYAYHWPSGRWSQIGVNTEVLLKSLTPGWTLDELDAAFGTDIDDASVFVYSLDSGAYQGGALKLAAFGADNKLAFFEGDNLAATVTTGTFQPNPNGGASITGVYPLVDGSAATCALASRLRLADTATFGSAISQTTFGKCNFATNSKYFTTKVVVAAGATWTRAQGIQVEATMTGAF